MPDSIVTLTTAATHAELFAALPRNWTAALHATHSIGDLLRALEQHDDVRIVLLEREPATRLGTVVERVRRLRPQVTIVLLSPQVGESVRAEFAVLGVDWLDRGAPPAEIAQELARRLERAVFQAQTGILGSSPRVHEVLEKVLQIGPTDIPVLITGPSGSGKELVARALGRTSRRRDNAFVAINVGALAESVLESELFGHEKGAFTNAVARRAGVFERAHGGTLFLDEVGEMSPHMQVRLLRVLESGEITTVGGTQVQRVDVRVIAATNRDLHEAVHHGDFRQDLYYRLKVVEIELPSLAERRLDLPQLVQHFLAEAAVQYGTPRCTVSEGAMRALQAYSWPGNIRELRNVVAEMAVLARNHHIDEAALPEHIRRPAAGANLPVRINRSTLEAERDIVLQSLLALRHDIQEVLTLLRERRNGAAESRALLVEPEAEPLNGPENLRSRERELIQRALEATHGNRRRAAGRLGIGERTLYRKLKEYGLS